jgi:hypothetical protein
MRCKRAASTACGLRVTSVSHSEARFRPLDARRAIARRDLITQQSMPGTLQIAVSVVLMMSPPDADASVIRQCRSSNLTFHPGAVDLWCTGDGDGMETAGPMGHDSAR